MMIDDDGIHLVENVTSPWNFWFGMLEEFAEREGHARVPKSNITASGHRLGNWVGTLRANHGGMQAERKARLEALPGWTWDVITDQWEEGFRQIQEFAEREGHARVPQTHKAADGFRLGAWVSNNRANQGNLSAYRKARLESLPGWAWAALSDKWEEGFRQLQKFVESEGHARVAANYKMASGHCLGSWVSTQRITRDSMPDDRKARLETLPGWIWDAQSEQWEEAFCHLKEFAGREGHARVPAIYKTASGHRLGVWVRRQRENQDNLSADRKASLEALPGWAWDAISDKWEEAFGYLKEFAEREGHARVPQSHITTSGHRLGRWVDSRRANQGSMPGDRKARLEGLLGWKWDTRSGQWEEGFVHLMGFAEREGHARVPKTYITPSGYKLGIWVRTQRINQDGMPVDRKARLEALPGWVWTTKK